MQLKAILLDADGTVWRGKSVIPEAPAFVKRAQSAGYRTLLVSNNAGPNREAYVEKCNKLGLAFSYDDIYSVNYIAGPYMKKHYGDRRVFIIGSDMLVESVRAHTECMGAGEWLKSNGFTDSAKLPDELSVVNEIDFDVVLVGIDVSVNYLKLALACKLVQNGADLIGGNPDYSFPFSHKVFLPGNGSLITLISKVSGVEPKAYLGKPSTGMLDQIVADTGINPEEMVMIGDRLETDIEFARNGGLAKAYFVETGINTLAEAKASGIPLTACKDLNEVADHLGI